MARKPRINPHDRGTAEYTLFAHWRRLTLTAKNQQQYADIYATDAGANRAKAQHYADTLTALGHPPAGQPKLIEGPAK